MEDIIYSILILRRICMIWGNISVVYNRCSTQHNTRPSVCVCVSQDIQRREGGREGRSSRAPFSSQDVSCASALLTNCHRYAQYQFILQMCFTECVSEPLVKNILSDMATWKKWKHWPRYVIRNENYSFNFVKSIDANQIEMMWEV